MQDMLDRQSLIPLYHQLKEVLREKVSSGDWQPDDSVPSEFKLMEMYGISRTTAQRALRDLTAEGVFYRQQGKGTFVNTPKLVHSLSNVYSFGDLIRSQGKNPSTMVVHLEEKVAPGSVRRDLHLGQGERVTEIRRLRMADHEPILLESTWVPTAVCPQLIKTELASQSLYDIFRKEYNLHIVRAEEYFEPVLSDDYESTLLQVEVGSPCLLIYRVAYTQDNKRIEVTKGIIRGDRSRYYVRLSKR